MSAKMRMMTTEDVILTLDALKQHWDLRVVASNIRNHSKWGVNYPGLEPYLIALEVN